MYNPIDIANYFLKKYGQENNITPMKLVKLVYISHGWYLGITDNALIDENPEAWKYGPVIPTIYHHFKDYGRNPIKLNNIEEIPDTLSKEITFFLEKIWEVYGKYTAVELSSKTHEIGTPWYLTWNKIQNLKSSRTSRFGFFSKQIPDTLIRDYYKKKYVLNKAHPE